MIFVELQIFVAAGSWFIKKCKMTFEIKKINVAERVGSAKRHAVCTRNDASIYRELIIICYVVPSCCHWSTFESVIRIDE